MPRRFPIAQFPNPPLLAAMAAGAVARSANGDAARAVRVVSDLALLVWAYREVTDGANWFRRLLGLGGAAYGIGGLARVVNHSER
ncbi:MAG: hypothetical protein ACR2MK_11345 [Solirubrobacteraceae bacterium]